MKRSAYTLTPENYGTACDLAGSALLRRVPAASTVLQITEGGAWNEFSTGVYIAADFENVIRYTGSAIREGSVGDRVQEHVLRGRAARWTRLMLVPLAADTEEDLVRRIEGRIGTVLRPLDTKRLPTLGAPRRPASRRASR
ncbi:hypothetical protein AVW11_04105 [Streptomyces amritsarensis]|uniref:GIY-YIG nuclease family protein n=1 Tax=Streptomyces amritsarensis TaxID=681158 RepID=A0ABX3GCR5_9ACTN|nr:hypothetical protein [Streptomyces amritsarensis]OLZ72583.1 hypothetical protein AVW11_04105 [Streptomyces amritsarensis]